MHVLGLVFILSQLNLLYWILRAFRWRSERDEWMQRAALMQERAILILDLLKQRVPGIMEEAEETLKRVAEEKRSVH